MLGPAQPVHADGGSLFPSTLKHRAPLVEMAPGDAIAQNASLFAGRVGVLAPPPVRQRKPLFSPGVGRATAAILDLVAQAEAGSKEYDAVQHGATIEPPKRPTDMTLGEIYDWIDDTPGQPHAIGRYQFIPATLKRLARALNMPASARFSRNLQDRLAERLLMEAGLGDYQGGSLKRVAFMNNLAKIWAGLPNETGRSHYHGYAGNKATMSWSRFEREMAKIFGHS